MSFNRRDFIGATGAALVLGSHTGASAQTLETARIYVGFPAGTSTDIVARIVANAVSPRIGQPIVVENRPGASGTIAATLAA
jgi:tripartite-type tricarboxylate transporter receptor subunit TctC